MSWTICGLNDIVYTRVGNEIKIQTDTITQQVNPKWRKGL